MAPADLKKAADCLSCYPPGPDPCMTMIQLALMLFVRTSGCSSSSSSRVDCCCDLLLLLLPLFIFCSARRDRHAAMLVMSGLDREVGDRLQPEVRLISPTNCVLVVSVGDALTVVSASASRASLSLPMLIDSEYDATDPASSSSAIDDSEFILLFFSGVVPSSQSDSSSSSS